MGIFFLDGLVIARLSIQFFVVMLENQLQKNTSFILPVIQKEIKMLTQEQRDRLLALYNGEEQLAIAEKWEQEKEERGKLIDKIGNAEKAGDYELVRDLMEVFCDTPDRCEHDRSIWTPCAGCEEIEHALHPEFYDENGDRLEDEQIEAIINANPERYN